MKRKLTVILAAVILAVTIFETTNTSALAASKSSVDAITFYSYQDNNPPGKGIKYPKVHEEAGGRGTYKDPITVSVEEGFLKPGTRLYVNDLKKYMIVEDLCGDPPCGTHGTDNYIDVWMNSEEDSDPDAIDACQRKWTRRTIDGDEPKQVAINPSEDLSVDTTPFFNTKTDTCGKLPQNW
jgi:3D (Asp-Asp-Asp) domain-containing protein